MNFKYIFAIAIVLSTVYSTYCQTCPEYNGLVCGNDGKTYSSVRSFCQANRSNSTAYIVKNGPCCDCQRLCYTTLTRGYNSNTKKHAASSRPMPGFRTEAIWNLPCDGTPNTHPLYECQSSGGSFLSPDRGCEGQTSLGLVGNIFDTQVDGSIPLFRCYSQSLDDHMVSPNANCESTLYKTESLLGYVDPSN